MRNNSAIFDGYVAAMDVVLVRWPEENFHLGELRGTGTPRLLLVGPDAPPPDSIDPLEDWIRLPAEDRDVRARVATLEARAANGMPASAAAPTIFSTISVPATPRRPVV